MSRHIKKKKIQPVTSAKDFRQLPPMLAESFNPETKHSLRESFTALKSGRHSSLSLPLSPDKSSSINYRPETCNPAGEEENGSSINQ